MPRKSHSPCGATGRAWTELPPELIARGLGKLIQDERLRWGMSQEALALRAGMDRSHYAKLERGERSISLVHLFRIGEALGCSCAALVKRVERDLSGRCLSRSLE